MTTKRAKKTVSSFNLLTSNTVSQSTEILRELAAKKGGKVPRTLNNSEDTRRMELPHFLLQILFRSRYVQSSSIVDIVAPESTGKTSLAFYLAGRWAESSNCMTYYQECENKLMANDYSTRLLHIDKKLADVISNKAITVDTGIHDLMTSVEQFEKQVLAIRGKLSNSKVTEPLPLDCPIFVVVDPWSNLMSPAEAEGYVGVEDVTKAKKGVGEAANFGHSKFAQALCRRVTDFIDTNHVLLTFIRHQNVKIPAMTGGYSAPVAADKNNTAIGGRAIAQHCSYQLIFVPTTEAKTSSGEVTGQNVKIRLAKNSYGVPGTRIEFEYRFKSHLTDTEDQYDSPFRFDEALAKFMVENSLLGTSVSMKKYTCKALGLEKVTGEELGKAIQDNEEIKAKLAAMLEIPGYTTEEKVEKLRVLDNMTQEEQEEVIETEGEDD